MGYQYEPTSAEVNAAALLRANGWHVSEPSCPDCHGLGWVLSSASWVENVLEGGSFHCPRGCPYASLVLTSVT